MTRNGRVHDGSADKFAKRKTLRRHRGYPGGVDWHWRTKDKGHRKVHSLIDKVYDRSNLTEAWKHVRENKGSAGIDGLTIAAFTEREDELLRRCMSSCAIAPIDRER